MWFLDKRIQVICEELKGLTIVKRRPVDGILYKEGQYFYPEQADQEGPDWRPFETGSVKWYGPDRHYWFRADYVVPEELQGQALRLHVRTQIEERDDGRNPQFLLFVDGRVTQGLDMNHRTVGMTEAAEPGTRWRLDLQAYTGTLHSEFDMILEMLQVDLRIEKLYYDLVVPLQAFDRMEREDRNRMEIEAVLNEAVNLLDLRTPYSEEFYRSVEAAERCLEQELYGKRAGYEEVIATCIGHTHIDVAWWWTVAQTREKVARSFATVLKLMEEYPDYRFMSSQPQLYQFLKERYPDVYQRVRERVKEGRWEPEGGMWLEADTNLTSGESLVRQFLYGKRFFREEFGVDCKILWLPDVFGYSGALPQIMKKSGIRYFMTTKLAWNQIDKMPSDTFRWKGIDGSEVFTHLITTLDIGQSEENFFTTYNGMLHPDAILGGWKRYQNKDMNHDILAAFGYGDGGGGPTREMLETAIRMKKGIRGIPKVRQEFAGKYFEELYERVKDSRRLPVWEGELYFEYHRGTYTSMARNKRANRKSEIMMMDLELLSVLAGFSGGAAEKERTDRMWRTILLNQFHDILPGSSIHEVYEVTKQEYAELAAEGEQMLAERMKAVAEAGDGQAADRMKAVAEAGSGETEERGSRAAAGVPGPEAGDRTGSAVCGKKVITLFNTLSFRRDDVVRLPGEVAGGLLDERGAVYPAQQVDGESFVYLRDLPSKGYKSFQVMEAGTLAELLGDGTAGSGGKSAVIPDGESGQEESRCPFLLADPRHLDTPYYRVELDENGMFRSLYDKQNRREILQPGKKGNRFCMYEDKPMKYNNWDIDIYYTEKSWDAEELSRMEWTAMGPVCACLELERPVSNSLIRQRIFFYRDTPRIDFETWVDWKDHQHLLKVHFPVDVHTDEASFDIQFGNLTRKIHTNTSWDMARFESCGQKWMDLSEGHYGVSLLNDCKYGHSVKDCEMALTLIKSGIEPNPVADQEEHRFTYSLYPHRGSLRESDTVRESYRLNFPVLSWMGGRAGNEASLLWVDQKNVMVETVKPAEDGNGLILRLYEFENARTETRLTFGMGKVIEGVQECDLLEEPEGQWMEHGDNSFVFTIRPYEIKTYRVLLKSV